MTRSALQPRNRFAVFVTLEQMLRHFNLRPLVVGLEPQHLPHTLQSFINTPLLHQSCAETGMTLRPAWVFPYELAKLSERRFAILGLNEVRLPDYPVRSGQVWIELHRQTSFPDGQARGGKDYLGEIKYVDRPYRNEKVGTGSGSDRVGIDALQNSTVVR